MDQGGLEKANPFSLRDQWFESISLQRGVRCEPDFLRLRGRCRPSRRPISSPNAGPNPPPTSGATGSRARLQLLARLTLNAGNYPANQPARLAQLDHGNYRAIEVQGDEGPAQVVRLGHRGTPSVRCSDEVAIPRRPPHSVYQSREGSDRSLDGLICWNREFPRCRLFRPGGAEVLRRNSGRIGGFEKGEFERHSARKQVAA